MAKRGDNRVFGVSEHPRENRVISLITLGNERVWYSFGVRSSCYPLKCGGFAVVITPFSVFQTVQKKQSCNSVKDRGWEVETTPFSVFQAVRGKTELLFRKIQWLDG